MQAVIAPQNPSLDDERSAWYVLFARLKPGVTLDQANAEMIAIARNIARDNPKTNKDLTSAAVQPLINFFTGVQLRQIVWAMLGAVILVLLIACVNVMNMQFGRVALRAKELAIRGALGATRWRLVRQMLTESLVVAVFGAVAGILLAYWSVDLLTRAMDALPSGFELPYWIRFTIDARVLAFTVAITLVATMASGLIPALISAHSNAAEMMKEGGRGNSSRLVNIITRLLVIGQIALTAALLIAATLEIRSIRNQLHLDYGYNENAIYSARLALLEGAKALLPMRQVLYLYGPYRRFGCHTSVSNEQFDSDLRAHNPEWGLRDLEAVSEVAARAGFALAEVVEMPANNFSLVFRSEG